MSDPRNVAHAKKVAQEKKHHGAEAAADDTAVQPGKKPAAAATKHDPAGVAAAAHDTAVAEAEAAAAAPPENTEPRESPAPAASAAALESALTVLAKLKEMAFHSRATLERLAELVLTVEDELKQKTIAGRLDEVYTAQNVFQGRLTALIEAYQAECDRMQG